MLLFKILESVRRDRVVEWDRAVECGVVVGLRATDAGGEQGGRRLRSLGGRC